MNRKHRGHCVVVNNHTFTSMDDRPGTDKDAGKNLWNSLSNASWGSYNHFFIFTFSFCTFNLPFKCKGDIINIVNVSGLLYVPGAIVHLGCTNEIP